MLRFELLTTIQYTYRRSPSSRYNCWSSLPTIGVPVILSITAKALDQTQRGLHRGGRSRFSNLIIELMQAR